MTKKKNTKSTETHKQKDEKIKMLEDEVVRLAGQVSKMSESGNAMMKKNIQLKDDLKRAVHVEEVVFQSKSVTLDGKLVGFRHGLKGITRTTAIGMLTMALDGLKKSVREDKIPYATLKVEELAEGEEEPDGQVWLHKTTWSSNKG